MTPLLLSVVRGGRPGPVRACLCDRRCDKAWGLNGRRHAPDGVVQLSDDDDDIAYGADHETGVAPRDTGTWEGGHAKPDVPDHHNKWCVRECERSRVVDVGEPLACPDFSARLYNIPSLHGVVPLNHETGRLLTADEPLGTRIVERRP